MRQIKTKHGLATKIYAYTETPVAKQAREGGSMVVGGHTVQYRAGDYLLLNPAGEPIDVRRKAQWERDWVESNNQLDDGSYFFRFRHNFQAVQIDEEFELEWPDGSYEEGEAGDWIVTRQGVTQLVDKETFERYYEEVRSGGSQLSPD